MKTLFIQIPCFNEADTLSITLSALPRKVKGFDSVKWLVINDGRIDRTAEVAQENRVDFVVNHVRNQGLARAFMTGIEACVQLGADVIVNTDADNQYNAGDIPFITTPILDGRAEIVIGTRPIDKVEHFSPLREFIQKFGSWVVRIASKTDMADCPPWISSLQPGKRPNKWLFSPITPTRLKRSSRLGRKIWR